MADEVDALMTIRGSLETTDGIDLVEEIAELGRLYSQASTVMGTGDLSTITTTATVPTINQQTIAETDSLDTALAAKLLEIASRRTTENTAMSDTEMRVAVQSYRTTMVGRVVQSIYEQNKQAIDATRTAHGEKFKAAKDALVVMQGRIQTVQNSITTISETLQRHSKTSGRDDEILRRENVARVFDKKMGWLREQYQTIDTLQRKIKESEAKEATYQEREYKEEATGFKVNPHDAETAAADHNKWEAKKEQWEMQVDKQIQQQQQSQSNHTRSIADAKKTIDQRHTVRGITPPGFDYKWFKPGSDDNGGAYKIAETIQARLLSDPSLHLIAVINQRKNDTYTNHRHYSPREAAGEDRIAEPTTRGMLEAVATDAQGTISEAMITAIEEQSQKAYRLITNLLPISIRDHLQQAPISIPKVPGDDTPTNVPQGLTDGDGLQLLDAIYRKYVAQDIYHTAQMMKSIQQASKNLEEHNPMRYLETTLAPLLQRAKKSMIKLPPYEMTPIIEALKDRFKHDSCKPLSNIASDPKWSTTSMSNSLDQLITMVEEVNHAYYNLRNHSTTVTDWDQWWSQPERRSARLQRRDTDKRANSAERHRGEPKGRRTEDDVESYGANQHYRQQSGGWGNHNNTSAGGWGSGNNNDGSGWGQRPRSRSRENERKGKGKGRKGNGYGYGYGKGQYHDSRERSDKGSHSSRDSHYYSGGRGRSPSPAPRIRQRTRSPSPRRRDDDHGKQGGHNHYGSGEGGRGGVRFAQSCKHCDSAPLGRGRYEEYCKYHADKEINRDLEDLRSDN